MKSLHWCFLIIAISCGFNLVQYYQISKLEYLNKVFTIEKALAENDIWELRKSNQDMQFTAQHVNQARQAGKIDGKIEVVMMMPQNNVQLTEEQADSLIKAASDAKSEKLEANLNFLSLLSQASFHKGLHTGLDQAEEMASAEYEKGYHKALEDSVCPSTGEFDEKKQQQMPKKPTIMK